MTTLTRAAVGGAVGLVVLGAACAVHTPAKGATSKLRDVQAPRAAAVETEQCSCIEPERSYTLRDWVVLMTGPGRCGPLWNDLDRDGDVDLADFAYLQNGEQ